MMVCRALPDVAKPGEHGYITGELIYPLDDTPTQQKIVIEDMGGSRITMNSNGSVTISARTSMTLEAATTITLKATKVDVQ